MSHINEWKIVAASTINTKTLQLPMFHADGYAHMAITPKENGDQTWVNHFKNLMTISSWGNLQFLYIDLVMPGYGPKFFNCVVCCKRTKPRERRIINKDVEKYLERKLFISVKEHDVICNKCKHKFYVAETTRSTSVSMAEEISDPSYVPPSTIRRAPVSSPPSVHLNILSTPRTHSRCIVCKKQGPKLVVVSSDAQFDAFMHHSILIAAGSRCCPVHVNDENVLKHECLINLKLTNDTIISRTGILNLLNQLREMCLANKSSINFDNIDDVDCKNLTSLNRAQFDDLFSHILDI
ncbi:hypothetical protein KUTeg_022599 [Tegillarca granosa]|uniref:Uncharacterized protein n=1 Tax=Tegillarca granosa TaxID=220873 RepID=A0ABQ9E7J1_TEGGR|nr:hypothetical protein KUTeg_022599 [Tegillarca granosa]